MEAMLIVITAEHESAVTVEKVLLKRYLFQSSTVKAYSSF